MAGEICPIFERESEEKINLIGVWMQHPINLKTMPDELNFLEVGHIAPMLSSYIRNEPCRQVPNESVEVGRGCKFLGGAFIMGSQQPAPTEPGGRPGVDCNYSMKQNGGVVILVREKLSLENDQGVGPSEGEVAGKKRWWQFWKSEKHASSMAETELDIVKSLLRQSSGARDFAKKISASSPFNIQEEGPMGVVVQGKNSRFIFSVLASHGKDKIFSLVYKEGNNPSITLVDEGKRNF